MRKYLPTLAELIDRLSIVQLKSIFIGKEYKDEIDLIMNDINEICNEKKIMMNGTLIKAILAVAITNKHIWENEAKARDGGQEQDKLLKLTHSINGVRNTSKNVISKEIGERVDLKIDCFAAELIDEFGNWRIWNEDT